MVLFCLVKTTFLARPFILIHFRINNLKALINSTIIDYTVTCGNGIWIMFVSRNIFDIIKEIINSSKQYIDIRYIGNDTEFITADTVAVTNVVKIIVDKISSVNNGFISKPVSVSICLLYTSPSPRD